VGGGIWAETNRKGDWWVDPPGEKNPPLKERGKAKGKGGGLSNLITQYPQ